MKEWASINDVQLQTNLTVQVCEQEFSCKLNFTVLQSKNKKILEIQGSQVADYFYREHELFAQNKVCD
jgi:hypothetical protein